MIMHLHPGTLRWVAQRLRNEADRDAKEQRRCEQEGLRVAPRVLLGVVRAKRREAKYLRTTATRIEKSFEQLHTVLGKRLAARKKKSKR